MTRKLISILLMLLIFLTSERRQRDADDIQPDGRDFGEQPKRKGFQHLDDEHAHHPERQQVARAHAPVDVQALLSKPVL